jgi:hypothetical protein
MYFGAALLEIYIHQGRGDKKFFGAESVDKGVKTPVDGAGCSPYPKEFYGFKERGQLRSDQGRGQVLPGGVKTAGKAVIIRYKLKAVKVPAKFAGHTIVKIRADTRRIIAALQHKMALNTPAPRQLKADFFFKSGGRGDFDTRSGLRRLFPHDYGLVLRISCVIEPVST